MIKRILIADDDVQDIEFITQILHTFESHHDKLAFDITSIQSMQQLILSLEHSSFDLLLLDLAFEPEHSSSIALMDRFPSDLPIIIISSLDHYQKPLIAKKAVKGFVSKSKAEIHLPMLLEEFLFDRNCSLLDEYFSFPAPTFSKTQPGSFATNKIRYIYHMGRGHYRITFVNGETSEIRSTTVSALSNALQKQHIRDIVQISQNEFININLINQIYKRRDGRIALCLIGAPKKELIVSSHFEAAFTSYLPNG